MTHTIVGIVASADGFIHGGKPSTRSADLRREQPSRIAIDREHNGQVVGEVCYIETIHGNTWVVGETSTSPTVSVGVGDRTVEVGTDLYFSLVRDSDLADRDIIIRSVSIVRSPARVGGRLTPIRWLEGDLSHRSAWHLDDPVRGLVQRAGEERHTRHGRPLHVRSYKDVWAGLTGDRSILDDQPPAGSGPLHYRTGGSVLSVH